MPCNPTNGQWWNWQNEQNMLPLTIPYAHRKRIMSDFIPKQVIEITAEAQKLVGANLSNIDLSQADLSHSNLTGARLNRANLSGAILNRAILNAATLRGANLGGATLVGAMLWNCDLRGADLRKANLSAVHLIGAVYNTETRWPEGFNPDLAGARKDDW